MYRADFHISAGDNTTKMEDSYDIYDIFCGHTFISINYKLFLYTILLLLCSMESFSVQWKNLLKRLVRLIMYICIIVVLFITGVRALIPMIIREDIYIHVNEYAYELINKIVLIILDWRFMGGMICIQFWVIIAILVIPPFQKYIYRIITHMYRVLQGSDTYMHGNQVHRS